MHAMKLCVHVMRAARRRSRATHAEHCHWSEGRHNNVGSLRESRATTQVMLGVSLRARWDATLVQPINATISKMDKLRCIVKDCFIQRW